MKELPSDSEKIRSGRGAGLSLMGYFSSLLMIAMAFPLLNLFFGMLIAVDQKMTVDGYQKYLKNYPNGKFVGLANQRLQKLLSQTVEQKNNR